MDERQASSLSRVFQLTIRMERTNQTPKQLRVSMACRGQRVLGHRRGESLTVSLAHRSRTRCSDLALLSLPSSGRS